MRIARAVAVALVLIGASLAGACGSKDNGGAIVPSGTTPTTAGPGSGGTPTTTPSSGARYP